MITATRHMLTITDPEHVMCDGELVGLRVRECLIRRQTPRILGPDYFDTEMTIRFEVTTPLHAWPFVRYFVGHDQVAITLEGQTFRGYATLSHWGMIQQGRRPAVELTLEVVRVGEAEQG